MNYVTTHKFLALKCLLPNLLPFFMSYQYVNEHFVNSEDIRDS